MLEASGTAAARTRTGPQPPMPAHSEVFHLPTHLDWDPQGYLFSVKPGGFSTADWNGSITCETRFCTSFSTYEILHIYMF